MGLFVVLGIIALNITATFLGPLLGVLAGALSGWIVGLFFTEQLHHVFAAFGLGDVPIWKIGMAMGFIGGFFKSTSVNNNQVGSFSTTNNPGSLNQWRKDA